MPGLLEIVRSDRAIRTDSPSSLTEETLFSGLYSPRPDSRLRAIGELEYRKEDLKPRTARRLAKLAIGGLTCYQREMAAQCLASHPSKDALPILLEALSFPDKRATIFDNKAEAAAEALRGTPFQEAKLQLFANAAGAHRFNPKSGRSVDAVCASALNSCKELVNINQAVGNLLVDMTQEIRLLFKLDSIKRYPGLGAALSEPYRLALNMVNIVSGHLLVGSRAVMLDVILEHPDRIHSSAGTFSRHHQEPDLCRACVTGLNVPDCCDVTTLRMVDIVRDARTPMSVRNLIAQALSKHQDPRVQTCLTRLATALDASEGLRAHAARGLLP